jgi:hypothetical protein
MDVYVFVYHVKPTTGSPEFGKIGGAHVDVWVNESSRDAAELKALARLMDCAWQVIKFEDELVISDAQISQYPPESQTTFYQAKTNGIAAFFVGYLPDGHEETVVEVRPIGVPQNQSDSFH